MKKDYTGWYEHGGYDLYVENGIVVRGTTKGSYPVTVYPYKSNRSGGWDKGTPTLETYKRSKAWMMK